MIYQAHILCVWVQEIIPKVIDILVQHNFQLQPGGAFHQNLQRCAPDIQIPPCLWSAPPCTAFSSLQEQQPQIEILVYVGICVHHGARDLFVTSAVRKESSHPEASASMPVSEPNGATIPTAKSDQPAGEVGEYTEGVSSALDGAEATKPSVEYPEDVPRSFNDAEATKAKTPPVAFVVGDLPTPHELLARIAARQSASVEPKDPLPEEPRAKAARKATSKVRKGSALASLPNGPEFMEAVKLKASTAEPPVFATQGADVGKTRGRKPGKAKAKPGPKRAAKAANRGKAKTNKKKVKAVKKTPKTGKRAKKCRGKARSGSAGMSLPDGEPSAAAYAPKNSRKRSRVNQGDRETHVPANAGASDQPVYSGPDLKPPSHVTANHVYSSAYRKHARWGEEYARQAGKLAATKFRETGLVDNLCGTFRTTTRAQAK